MVREAVSHRTSNLGFAFTSIDQRKELNKLTLSRSFVSSVYGHHTTELPASLTERGTNQRRPAPARIIHLAVHTVLTDKHLKKGLGTLTEQKFSTDCLT